MSENEMDGEGPAETPVAVGNAIAIDGPAASGKSSVARELATRLGYVFVNSGAMYRAFAWHVLNKGVDPSNHEAVVALLAETHLDCGEREGRSTIAVDGVDPGEALTAEAVNAQVSAIAAIPEVRERLVAAQRGYLKRHSVVMEGRDIGSVVFPDTPYKFYVDASPEVRERRRRAQGIADEIGERDRKDAGRKVAPLVAAADAHIIDSSELSLDQVVEVVLARLRDQGLAGV